MRRLELAATRRIETRLGLLSEPYRQGRAGRLLNLGRSSPSPARWAHCWAAAAASSPPSPAPRCWQPRRPTRFGIYQAGVACMTDPATPWSRSGSGSTRDGRRAPAALDIRPHVPTPCAPASPPVPSGWRSGSAGTQNRRASGLSEATLPRAPRGLVALVGSSWRSTVTSQGCGGRRITTVSFNHEPGAAYSRFRSSTALHPSLFRGL
jgi:hypothetical protein